jgi:hypothetical protein
MKNRRLNVLFIAIIALAAAPQALQDARGLANVLHEQAETKFWNIFLSYQTPDAARSSELVARRGTVAREACPLERMIVGNRAADSRSKAVTSNVAKEKNRVPVVTPNAVTPEPVEPVIEDEMLAVSFVPRTIEFAEKEKNALKVAKLHGAELEKLADMAAKLSMASTLVPGDQNIQIRTKQAMEFDRLMRRRARNNRERSGDEREALPEPKAEEGM